MLQVEGATRHTLAANLVWDDVCTSGHGPTTLLEASAVPLGLINTLNTPEATNGTLRPLVDIEASKKEPNEEAWHEAVERLLCALQGSDDSSNSAVSQQKLPEPAIQV